MKKFKHDPLIRKEWREATARYRAKKKAEAEAKA